MSDEEEDPDLLQCVVETGGEVRRITIRRYIKEPEDKETPYGVRIDGFIDDGVSNIAEILERYGDFYWDDLDDFVANRKKGKSLKDWLKP